MQIYIFLMTITCVLLWIFPIYFFISCTVNYYLSILCKKINTDRLIINVRIHKRNTNYAIIMNEKKLFVSLSSKLLLYSKINFSLLSLFFFLSLNLIFSMNWISAISNKRQARSLEQVKSQRYGPYKERKQSVWLRQCTVAEVTARLRGVQYNKSGRMHSVWFARGGEPFRGEEKQEASRVTAWLVAWISHK